MSCKRLIASVPMLLVIAAALAGCNHHHDYINVHIDDGIRIHQGHVTISAADAPDAIVTKRGDLKIGGHLVHVAANQHRQLQQYYRQAVVIEQQGIAAGKAGASMAGGTIGDVTKNLLNGHPDRIDAAVNKRKNHLLAKVAVICDSLRALRDTQETLRARIPAFRPYARIKASDVEQCRQGIEKGRNGP